MIDLNSVTWIAQNGLKLVTKYYNRIDIVFHGKKEEVISLKISAALRLISINIHACL